MSSLSTTTGLMEHRPWQPMMLTSTLSPSPASCTSWTKVSKTAIEPANRQAVPAQTLTL